MTAFNLSLRTRIYLSMLVIILLSFVVIGLFTYLHFKKQNQSYHQERLQRKENAVIKSISYFLEQDGIYRNPDSVMVAFSDKITELADINNLDINIYNLKGELLLSTHTTYFKNGIFVFQLKQDILNQMDNPDARVVTSESTDSLNILSAYRFMTNNLNKPIAIINLPYLKNDDISKREVGLFLTRLAEIYILLFIGASFIAFFLSRYIIDTLRTIKNKIQQIDLGKKNEPIQWKVKDEVGALVDEYNRMLAELEKSAELLAKSERETAWREMAKQVAHEIKNPLTPMKLSIQHLERTLQVDESEQEKFRKFCSNLIEQIDELSNIASAFSNFAQMPKSNAEELDLKEEVDKVIELFKETTQAAISKNVIGDNHVVYADKGQISRVLNNLVKNAIHAVSDKENPTIEIILTELEDQIQLDVVDNGIGMSQEEQQQAFTPNFTTKTSGMGLGLPMVKNIVKNMNGTIEINSEKNHGARFTILFPKYS